MNRLYGWRGNPLYQSGTLVVLAFVVMLVTGVYLLLFYRVSGPYESMLRIDGQIWAGRWIRSLHRYAADLTVIATLVHVLRMFVQGRSWGARTLAWVSGLFLFFLMFVCGWTGYVMIWDEHGRQLAIEGARLLDAVPIFAEPLARTFVGERPIPGAFFFLNLFAHVALPIGVALLLWVHVSRVARPVLLPPRGLTWATIGLLVLASVVAPSPLGPEADLFALPERVSIDVFYSFWLPFSRGIPPLAAWAVLAAGGAFLLLAPVWSRPRPEARPPASQVDARLCTGCFQCSYDCPYEAIAMVPFEGKDHPVSRVDPALCVGCGICAGSCAPMIVGPPAWAGRDELARARAFTGRHELRADDVVVVACERGGGGWAARPAIGSALVYRMHCAGNLHTSVVELMLRSGAGGVLIAACPPRDCWGREGPRWLEERLYAGREAELRESIDRRRLSVVYAGEAEGGVVRDAVERLRGALRGLDVGVPETSVAIDTECDGPREEIAS